MSTNSSPSPTLRSELADVQGIITRGYAELPGACFLLLRVMDARAARRWISGLIVTTGAEKPTDHALNIAFSYEGLTALGIPKTITLGFSEEFVDGMTASQRQLALGDGGDSDPREWEWGGPATATVHALLMLYAADQNALDSFRETILSTLPEAGLEQIGRALESMAHVDPMTGLAKEHFGFADALSQPFIEGLGKDSPPFLTVKTGEFILGYPNEYGKMTERPLVPEPDHGGALPADLATGEGDLGRNGTYLVFRHLEQDPCAFWQFAERATRDSSGVSTKEARIRLAAKMVGRWPSGAPLVLAPDADAPEARTQNDFRYHEEDARGLRCPLGAHIRRTNPRDSLGPDPGSEKSIAVNKRHQILRRGRIYGSPVAASMDPDDIMRGDSSGERGLYFICLNANISRQFEFVQHSWVNSPKFAGLYADPDPLVGARSGLPTEDVFTIPADPVRQRAVAMPGFVKVRGGGYFFLPGIRALRYLGKS
jgi:Dyp-type peroxidase family